MLSKQQWRLGHHRPWWQWNVLTLFVMLFTLAWMREILTIGYGTTWLLCGVTLFVWVLMPALGVPLKRVVADELRQFDEEDDFASKAFRVAVGLLIVCVSVAGMLIVALDVVSLFHGDFAELLP